MIFYFSGTGNSQHTAKKIAAALGEEVTAIADYLKNDRLSFRLGDGERLGFIFPVYFYGIPTIVRDFIGRLDLQNYRDNYTFSVYTCGDGSGNTQIMLQKCLTRRGIRLDAAFEVKMPDNYILLFNLLPPADKAERLVEAAEGSIDAIAESIRDRKPVPAVATFVRQMMTVTSYPLYKYGRNTRSFSVSKDCNGCGLCARQCPCSMIDMQERLPVWKAGKCTQCLSCLHRCPKRAIQYGKKTQSRGRYVYPSVR